jgi:predicted phage terminase large subunit-like protein
MYWIEDIVRVQYTPFDSEELIKNTAQKDGYNVLIRMEKEPGSSGDITTDHYARHVLAGYNFLGVSSTGSKVERAKTASSAAQAGYIFITQRCRNMLPFLDEVDMFPYGTHDDTVDALTGAFNTFRKNIVLKPPTGVSKTGGSYWRNLRR